jgi:cbb3-type cytochrome oxidase subunit 3
MSTLADQAFLLVLITICLGACVVRAFWEIEQSRERQRQQSRNAVPLNTDLTDS